MRRLLAVLLCLPGPALAQLDANVQVSSFGAGLELGYRSSPHWQWRVGNLHGDLDIDFKGENNNGIEGDELDYDSDISLKNFYVLADWHPSGKRFKVSGGLILNNSEASIVTSCQASSPIPGSANCEFGNARFSPEILGEIHTDIDFPSLAPYLGIGWSQQAERGLNWGVDLGLAYIGEANVAIRSTGSCNDSAECRAQISREEDEVREELSNLKFLPLLKLALGYRF